MGTLTQTGAASLGVGSTVTFAATALGNTTIGTLGVGAVTQTGAMSLGVGNTVTIAALTVTGATTLAAVGCTTFASSGTTTLNALTVTTNVLVSGTTTYTGAVLYSSTETHTGNIVQNGATMLSAVTTAIAAGAIANATFAADVGSTAYATNKIALAADKAIANYDAPTATEMTSAFTEIKGATWATTDTLEAIRDRGDAAWVTATSVTVSDKSGFSLSATGADLIAWNSTFTQAVVTAIWEEALAGYTTTGSAGKTLSTAGAGGVDTAALADAIWNEAAGDHVTLGTTGKALVDVLADTGELQTNQGNWVTATGFATATELAKVPKSDSNVTWNNTALAAIQSECNDALVAYDPPTKAETDTAALTAWTTALTEAYPTYDATSITPAQALYAILQSVSDFAISGLNISVKNLAGTEAMKFTMDSATVPTSRTRVAP
jgi:hypothetical protein